MQRDDNATPATRGDVTVFLSYSSRDARLARRLADDLRAADVDVWLDQWQLRIGEEFVQDIERGVDDCDFVIVLLTPHSVASNWVYREWSRKVNDEARGERVSVVPVLGAQCDIPGILAGRSHADVSGGSYPLGLRHLLEILRHHTDAGRDVPSTETATVHHAQDAWLPAVTPIAVEVGADLIPFVEDDRLARAVQNGLEADLGVPIPDIRFQRNVTDMPADAALIMIDEVPEVLATLAVDEIVVDASIEQLAHLGLDGTPIPGGLRSRISPADRARAHDAGHVTWDTIDELLRIVKAVVRPLVPGFVDIDVTCTLVEAVADAHPDLVAATVPARVSWFELTDVLQRLLDEFVSVEDLPGILAALSTADPNEHDTAVLAELARTGVRGHILSRFDIDRGRLSVIRLAAEIEAHMRGAIKRITTTAERITIGSYLALDPDMTQRVLGAIRHTMERLGPMGDGVPVLTSAAIRRYVRKLVELELPSLHVLSHDDLEPGLEVKPIATVRLDSAERVNAP